MNNMPLITDANNRFYAGMTLAEAKRNGTDKSWWRRDFYNLDKNGDGVLSVDEIMNERKRSANLNKIGAGLMAGFGVFDIMSNKGSKGWLIFDLLLDTFFTYSCLNKAIKTDRKTKMYEEQIKAHNINRYA